MLFRALIFVVIALLIAFAASWLSAQEGVTIITWLGYRAEVSSSMLVVAIGLLCIGGILIDRIVRALIRWPSLFSAGWQARRRAKGETALSLGFVALAAGDNRAAIKQARRAEKLLDKGILTDLLVAQSSYASGDHKAAMRYFKKLADAPETAYFGQLGLMRLYQQETAGEIGAPLSKDALLAANSAFALDASSAEAAQVILRDALAQADWAKARDCLQVYLNQSGGQSESEIKGALHLYASLSLQMAQELVEDKLTADAAKDALPDAGTMAQAIALCEQAISHAPAFTPARQQLVKWLVQKGDKKAAAKQAAKGFDAMPHISSLEMLRLVRDENDGKFITYAMGLAAKSAAPDDGYLAVAAYAISVGIWASASQALSHLSEGFIAHNEFYRLQAAIAQGLDDEAGHQAALEQAAQAPRAASWSCQSCGHIALDYDYICKNCAAPHALGWAK